MNPIPAPAALDAYFLEARCKLLDLAAILDRVERGPDAARIADDPRLIRLRHALQLLAKEGGTRAEDVQKHFSLDYDPSWKIPAPRSA